MTTRTNPPVSPHLDHALTRYTRAKTAEIMDCSMTTVDRLAKSGELKPTRVGGRIYFTPEAIAACLGQTLPQVAA
jgi:Helix-turn-helix domain